MRVAIVGSRSVTMDAYPDILSYIPRGASEIISGGAEGADEIAEEYARQHHLPLTIIRPKYKNYRKAAPLQRNLEIVRRSDYVLVLWDGKSRGAANIVVNCIQEYIPVHLLLIRNGRLVQTLFGQADGHLL